MLALAVSFVQMSFSFFLWSVFLHLGQSGLLSVISISVLCIFCISKSFVMSISLLCIFIFLNLCAVSISCAIWRKGQDACSAQVSLDRRLSLDTSTSSTTGLPALLGRKQIPINLDSGTQINRLLLLWTTLKFKQTSSLSLCIFWLTHRHNCVKSLGTNKDDCAFLSFYISKAISSWQKQITVVDMVKIPRPHYLQAANVQLPLLPELLTPDN